MANRRVRWELAGLDLRQLVSSDAWAVPTEVELVQDALHYRYDGEPIGMHSDRKLLELFLGLVDAEPKRIARFAGQYGMLHICRHGVPATHAATRPEPLMLSYGTAEWTPDVPGLTECQPTGWTGVGGVEELFHWRRFARQARSVISIASELKMHKPGSQEEWSVVLGKNWRTAPPEDLTLQRELLASAVGEWLSVSDIRPRFTWHHDEPGAQLSSGGGLFGALALQILMSVSGKRGIRMCEHCGQPFQMKRADNRYCSDACVRNASYRRRKAAKREKPK